MFPSFFYEFNGRSIESYLIVDILCQIFRKNGSKIETRTKRWFKVKVKVTQLSVIPQYVVN